MISLVRTGGRLPRVALAAGLAAWLLPAFSSPCRAQVGPPGPPPVCPTCHKPHPGNGYPKHGYPKHPGPGVGTLGYGPPGLHPGFQGFGLGYHRGYGYGGPALGVGADGGYPFYGGPGYPHPWPRLRRLGGINPFPFYGGPGGPTPECPNYYGPTGPLVADPPVIEIEREPGEADYNTAYGMFTGVVPYPESVLAPFTTSAAAGGSASGVSSVTPLTGQPSPGPAAGEVLDERAASRTLGVDVEPFTDPGGKRALKVTRVYPGSPAQRGGLSDGDVIRSANGYATELPANLAWIIANAAPGRVLTMSVRAAECQTRKVTDRLP
jgi:hypothetical protein